MANIKFDLSQTVRQVEALGQATQTLVSSLEQAMGRLGSMSGLVNQNLQRVATGTSMASSVSPVSAGMMTNIGQNYGTEFANITKSDADRSREILQQVAAGSLDIDPSSGKISKNLGPSAAGTRIQSFGTESFHSGRIAAYESLQMEAQRNVAGTIRSGVAAPSYSAPGISRSIAGAGITGADIPRIMQGSQETQKNLSGIDESIRKMRLSDDKRERAIATELSRLVTEFSKISSTFEKTQQKVEAGGPERYRESREISRNNAAGQLRNTQEQINDLLNQTQGGGGGGGGRFGLMQKITKGIGIAAGVGGGLAAGANAYYSTAQAIGGTTVGAERQATLAEGAVQSQAFRTVMAQLDTNNAENLFRFGGDLLFGEEFAEQNKFLGRGGYMNAMSVGVREARQQRRMQGRAEKVAVMNAGMQIGTSALETGAGAAATLGTGGLTSMFGAGFAASGIRGMSGGLQALGQARYGTPYAAFTGRLEDSSIAQALAGPEALAEIPFARKREFMQDAMSVQRSIEDLQGGQLQKLSPVIASYQRLLDIEQAEKQAVRLIGGSALTRGDVTDIVYAPRQDALNAVRSGMAQGNVVNNANAVNIAYRAAESAKRAGANGGKLTAADLEMGLLQPGPGESVAGIAQRMRDRNVAGLTRGHLDTLNTPSIFEELELSPSEAVARHASLVNTLNISGATSQAGKASQLAMMAKVTRMGRAGVGSFEQITGNLGSIQATTGVAAPEDNIQRLERVMSSAIAAGFDNSKMAQSFVQSTTSIARAVRTRDVAEAAGVLGRTATLSAGFGRATSRDLEVAASGIAGLEGFTGQTGGVMGGMKAINMARAGATLSDMAILGGMGATGSQALIKQLDKAGGNIQGLRNIEADPVLMDQVTRVSMQRIQANTPSKYKTWQDFKNADRADYEKVRKASEAYAIDHTRKVLQANVDATDDVIGAAASHQQQSAEGLIKGIEKSLNTYPGSPQVLSNSDNVRQSVSQAVSAFTGVFARTKTGGDIEAARGMALAHVQNQMSNMSGFDETFDIQNYLGRQKSGQAVYNDVANQNMVKYMDSVLSGMSGDINRKASKEEYFAYIAEGGRTYGNFNAQTIQKARGGGNDAVAAQNKIAKFFGANADDIDFTTKDFSSFMNSIQKAGGDISGSSGSSLADLARGRSAGVGQAKEPESINIVGITDAVAGKLARGIAYAIEGEVNKDIFKAVSGKSYSGTGGAVD